MILQTAHRRFGAILIVAVGCLLVVLSWSRDTDFKVWPVALPGFPRQSDMVVNIPNSNNTAIATLLAVPTSLQEVSSRLDALIRTRLVKARANRKRMENDFFFWNDAARNESDTLFITLIAPDGGLGNLMFMVASLVGVARKNHRVPVLISTDHRLKVFEGLALEVVDRSRILAGRHLREAVLHEDACSHYTRRTGNLSATPFANRTVALQGYLQSFMYFDEFRDEIRAMFTFKESILTAARTVISDGVNVKIAPNLTEVVTLVGIHVRRGDILHDPHKSGGQVPASGGYLLRTTKEYRNKYVNTIFFVISNDIGYCQQLFQDGDFFFVTGTSTEIDMAIMTLMDQVIMSVGSYSFWSAYLNDQATDITYFRDWPRKGSGLASITNVTEYFLPFWRGEI